MSLGKDAVVDAPDTLREEIAEEFKQSIANYG
jgi:predicted DNA-binding transcriptional regulator YafY